MLESIVISKVRVKLLQVLLTCPTEIYYVRQLVRAVGEEINAVRRELSHLEKAGLIKRETRGNRVYYRLEKQHPLFSDLLSIVHKSVGLGGLIYTHRRQLGNIKFALLSGRYARGLPPKEGGVDLLIVGEINLTVLADLIKKEEARIDREINYSAMTKEEFNFRKKRRDPFLGGILSASRIVVIGDEEEAVEQ